MRTDPALQPWRVAVAGAARRASHPDAPGAAFGSSSRLHYHHRTDTIHIDRGFAARWAPTSPQAMYLIVHELKHRITDEHHARIFARALCTPGPLLALGATLVAAAFWVALANALLAVPTIGCPFVAAAYTLHAAQPARFELEFTADDYATDTLGLTGATILINIAEDTGFTAWATGHPSGAARLARQRQRGHDKEPNEESLP